MKISFSANIQSKINPKFKTKASKQNTITILGSSKSVNSIADYMAICSNATKAMVLSGKNLCHGCGTYGIMGAAYQSGAKYSTKDSKGKPEQNLAILTKHFWGDEDLEHCTPIAIAKNEADRIKKFTEVSDTMIIFPGSTGTLQEAATLISENYYGKPEDKKKIILVGSDFFKGLIEQYNNLYKTGLINCPVGELFSVANSEEEIAFLINK